MKTKIQQKMKHVLLLYLVCVVNAIATSHEKYLWDLADRENFHTFESLTDTLIELKDSVITLESERTTRKMEPYLLKLKRIISEELAMANKAVQEVRYSDASKIYSSIVKNGNQFLDNTSLITCYQLYGRSAYREAMIGNATWNLVVSIYEALSTHKTLDDGESYFYHQARKTVDIFEAESEGNQLKMTDNIPYVLYFHIPQNAQTPSLGHFGHAMFDGLWPFCLHYYNGTFDKAIKSSSNKYPVSVYILDIGLYLVPLFQSVFQHIRFIPFHSITDIPSYHQAVHLYGVGMAQKDNNYSNLFKTRLSTSHIAVVRDVIYQQLGITSSPRCIILLSRTTSKSNLNAFANKHKIDMSREGPLLHRFHDTGPHMYTALHYIGTTGSQRRTIVNEQEVFDKMYKVFYQKYDGCVKLVELDKLSFRDQFKVFANAKVVVGQHGAGLTFAGFMPNGTHENGVDGYGTGSYVLELLPHINPTFAHACNATGVNHMVISREKYPDIYVTENNNDIVVNPKKLVRLITEVIQGWEPPAYDARIDGPFKTSDSNAMEQVQQTPMLSAPPSSESCAREIVQSVPSVVLPEVSYIKIMLQSAEIKPFWWIDSGFRGFPGYSPNSFSGKSRSYWRHVMRRDVYSKHYNMPQKIMASPTNVYSFYETFTYAVVNLTPEEENPNRVVLQYIYLKNGTAVQVYDDFEPFHFQVQGPDELPDVGFIMMDDADPTNISYTNPVIARGEHYYVRISGVEGTPFYDIYAKDIMCAAFNSHRSKGYKTLPHEIVKSINRTSIFFSKTGAVTNLHYDESGMGAVLCQLKGSKRIVLWPPGEFDNMGNYPAGHPYYRRSVFNKRNPFKQSRKLAESKHTDMIVDEGQCIFMPVGWWHYIESLSEDTISVRFTIENL